MGNHRFRFADMMPNAWFYKLKDMNKGHKATKVPPPVPFVPKRTSYYFPSSSPSHPKAHDTRFPLRSPTNPTQKPPPTVRPVPAFELEHKLRPVLTKPAKRDEDDVRTVKRSPARRQRIRANSPKVRVAWRRGRGVAESFVVVKCSSDPRRDFRESMMEMIAENGLRAGRDLEELLACYLSLNSDEYHGVIVKVFEEIWFDVALSPSN